MTIEKKLTGTVYVHQCGPERLVPQSAALLLLHGLDIPSHRSGLKRGRFVAWTLQLVSLLQALEVDVCVQLGGGSDERGGKIGKVNGEVWRPFCLFLTMITDPKAQVNSYIFLFRGQTLR